MPYTLQHIADKIGATIQGDPRCEIFSAASLASATEKDICFVKDKQHAQAIADSKAAALIVSEDVLPKDDTQHNFLIVPQPRLSFITVLHLLYPEKKPKASIHPTAVLGEGVKIADGVTIKAYAVLGDRVKVGANTIIESNANVGDDVVIGDGCRIYANASLYRQTQLGNRCIIHSGAVIGADGFGFEADENGRWQKVPQVGCVKLADDVEIGANTCIDCGALDDTEIAKGVKIDDQVMIGHNVKIGAHTIIAGGVGIAGSTTIGKHCMLGGASCINGHITLTDGVMVAGSSNIGSSIEKPGFYLGALEALPYREWARCAQKFYQLNEMKKTLNKLEKAVIA